MSKRNVKRAAPAQPTELARLIDDALQLLAERSPTGLEPSEGPPVPLPSLLARCEAVLADSGTAPEPLRLVHSFDGAGCVDALQQIPNVRLVPSDWVDGAGRVPVAAVQLERARTAALMSLQDGLEGVGARVVIFVDHQFGRAAAPDLRSAARLLRGVVVVQHPLLSYLDAHRRGALPFRPASLEAFAERYLAFMDDHGDLPIVTADLWTANPAEALRLLGLALDLPVSSGVLAEVAADRRDNPPAAADDGLPKFRYADGSLATEEPLDSPHYLRLCARLGFDPDQLPADPVTIVRPHFDHGTPRPRPAMLPPRTVARVSAIFPMMSRILADWGGLDAYGLVAIMDDCLSRPDQFYNSLDRHLRHVSGQEAALLMIGCASHFAAKGESVHALGMLAEAADLIDAKDRPLHLLAAEVMLRLRKPDMALEVLTRDATQGPFRLEPAQQTQLQDALAKIAPPKSIEHGHALLLNRLETAPPVGLGRRRVLIEIGTTRERVPGQGSTEKLAQICARLNMDFITVDMDPRNTANANRLFRRTNLPGRAVTAKGEDFLAEFGGPIDFCFLDAYDFDHGNHSELRQSRYETYLGSRIADEQCHQMHLDCATSLVSKLSADGAICFDDTWTDEAGAWTAKGTTAMPYLLAHGFKVVEVGNRAAMLERV